MPELAQSALLFISALGGVAGFVTVLQFLNTRRSVKAKGEADVAAIWNDLTEGALKAANLRIEKMEERNIKRDEKEDLLVDLVYRMINDMSINSTLNHLEYQRDIEKIRRM